MAIGNALLLIFVLGGWFVDLIYALPGFPETDAALAPGQRRDLAADGMAAIRPLGPGVDLLREADLTSADPAFNSRELTHMEDVRQVVAGFAIAWLAGLGLLAVAWFGRRPLGGPEALRRAARTAAIALLAAVVAFGLLLLFAFEPIFEGFHAIFFSGDSWRFHADDTLLQLYPEMFWAAAGTVTVLLVVTQLLLVVGLSRPLQGRLRR